MNQVGTTIIMMTILAIPAFGSGVPDKPNPLEFEKYSTVTVLSRLPLPEQEFGMVAQQLPMKPGFTAGVPVPLEGSKKVYPLLNLDVFLVVKGKPTELHAEEAEEMKLAVTVVIPDSFTKRITSGALSRVSDLLFWDEQDKRWIPFEEYVKDKEVSPLIRGPGYLSFEIYSWPLGDRMIGCI